ncbi:tRNA (adenosine(37)-N6)-threonylcarbamoyltransferase complex transferase subunit TsaD [Candidatus Nomurabacteria bacterium RIFCSPHIGHO2_01_FULL_42_15]|uniref:tRNA N6-adenosine threonylcarbamoyltransferase n=1 Tax=Candidatus Nomurabacteria bacterium RIFCSPHIGHO2_01_FULL_42_15 TaxID=1801742 RepID=A0A1F6VFQ3_9BACT|nr:MAG: tRNA (adenosine(37)-N6)-threonylcarbamoyltransferase complex transferase subunit TsaD [Candidatus Nomurabacteria bacterium RIFCSPHIGHO2_01_FULL_42_15]OGI93151.1 MAG: tRNA (adenosine(37)-N6)-threonylcarbamoyltransferase complex transferase subunit TsaD [Candidatus Nomurabacteria bacterium RIFCSPLOWO2_01_FULL_41_18]
MKILSIETSCDDTAISIMEVSGGSTNAFFKVLANNSNSQINIHIPYGGVYPVLAKREHAKNLPIILEASLKQAKLEKKDRPVDAIAVTYGPGLEMCLWEGIMFAKNLAKKWSAGRRSALPIIPVNHMEGHVLSVFGKGSGNFKIPALKFPILSLLVSGGHTQLVFMKKWMDYEIIGETLDDAVGEAFDKVARMLDLPYPGGPQISKLAEELRAKEEQYFRGLRRTAGPRTEQIFLQENRDPEKISSSFALPRPMLYSKNFDFSFSGLKTAVLYLIRDLGGIDKLDQITKTKIALEFENSAIECLIHKTKKAVEKYGAKTLIVAGGVACNIHLQREMSALGGSASGGKKIKILFPSKGLAGDNSLMIGIAGYLNYIKNKKKVPKLNSIKATGNLRL